MVKRSKRAKRPREVQYLASGLIAELASETGAFFLAAVNFNARFPARRRETWDIVCRLKLAGQKEAVTLVLVCRNLLSPKTALALVDSRPTPIGATFVLFAPAISPRVAEICRQRRIGYLDEAGNCLVRAGNLYIERSGRGNVRPDTRPIRRLFSPKSSRVTRAMLSEPFRRWQVQELAAASQVSLGLAAKVKQTLLAEGYAVERDRRLLLRDPDALFRAWAQAYDRRVAPIRLFVPGAGKGDGYVLPERPKGCFAQNVPVPFSRAADAAETIARWLESHGVTFALTDLAGAWRAAPVAEATRIAFWVAHLPDSAWADLRQATGGAHVESGENVVLYPTDDPSVFAGARLLGKPPLPTVSPLQLYLDLQLLDDGAAAAAAVYEQELEPRFASAFIQKKSQESH